MARKGNNKKSKKTNSKNSNSNKNIINIKIGGGKKGGGSKKQSQGTPTIYNNVSQPTNRPQYLDTNTLSQQEQQFKVLSAINKKKQDNEIKLLSAGSQTEHHHPSIETQTEYRHPISETQIENHYPFSSTKIDGNQYPLSSSSASFQSPEHSSSQTYSSAFNIDPEYSSIKRLSDYANKIDDSMEKIIKTESKKDKIIDKMKDNQQYYRSIGIPDDLSNEFLKMNKIKFDKEINNPSSSSSSYFNSQYPQNINLLSSSGNEPPTTTIHDFLEIKDPNIDTSENRYAILASDDDNEDEQNIIAPVDYQKQIYNYKTLREIAIDYVNNGGDVNEPIINDTYKRKFNMLRKSMDVKHGGHYKYKTLIDFLNDDKTRDHIKLLKQLKKEQEKKLKK
jgi:hypothetical protein